MKQLFVTLIILIICGEAYTQGTTWEVNSTDYEFSMSYSAVAVVNGTESIDTEDKLAAFVDGEVRGVAEPFYVASTGRYYFFLLVYSNGAGETVSFSFYDNSELEVVALKNQEIFVSDHSEGSFSDPYIFTDEYAVGFRSFDFVGIEDEEVVIDSTQQHVVVQIGDNDPENLIASFEQSGATSVKVNGVEQESGVTNNDFSSVVEYVFTDGGGNEYTWTVEVMYTISSLEDAWQTLGIKVYGNPFVNTTKLTAEGQFSINVYDLKGMLIYEGEHWQQVSLGDDWGPGIYLAEIVKDEVRSTVKLVKR